MTRTSRLLSARSLGRAGAELGLIVVGILLALWIDGRVEARAEAALERHYMTLLARDLKGTLDDLDRLARVNADTGEAAIEAYRMLHLPPDRIEGDRLATLLRAVGRRLTPRLRKAAYTELLSNGGLPLIRDPALRDEVVRFYEEADRLFNVLDKNATLAADGRMSPILYGEGLVGAAVHPDVDPNEGLLIDDPTAVFLAALGPDFEPAPHRLLRLPTDAPEWARVRGAVYQVHQTSTNAVRITGLLRESALALLERMNMVLGSSSRATRDPESP